MTSNQIYQQLEPTIRQYLDSLEHYSDEKFLAKKDAETWSLGEMYEHVCLSGTHFFLANVNRCLENRKGQEGGEKNANGENAFKYGGFPPIKIKMPDALKTPAMIPKSRETYKSILQQILDDTKAKVEAVGADAGTYKTYHPALGWLNAHEWLWNLEMHFRHHLRQKAELEA